MSSKWLRVVLEYSGVFVGVILTALAMVLFLIPNKIVAGGTSGLGTVLFHTVGIPVGLTMLVINGTLFIFGVRELGLKLGIKTLVGIVTFALSIEFLGPLVVPITTDPLLAALYGGILAGIGTGIVLKSGGSFGGTDLAAQILKKFTGLTSGQGLMIIDAFVIATAAIFFSVELALFGLIGLFATAKVIDMIQDGLNYTKAAFIISNNPEKVTQKIFDDLDRGVTILKGQGAYSGKERDVILVVVSQTEVARLKTLVRDIDRDAFVIISNVHEALGEGFKKLSKSS